MCPAVPWNTINQLVNTINGSNAWTPTNMKIAGLPGNTFPIGTVRFDSCEPIKRIVPAWPNPSGGSPAIPPATGSVQWWDILYKFSWRTVYAYWTNSKGVTAAGPVTWNCDWFPGCGGPWGGFAVPILGTWGAGWYEAGFYEQYVQGNGLPGYKYYPKYVDAQSSFLSVNSGPLIGSVNHPFDVLFLQTRFDDLTDVWLRWHGE